MSNTLDKIIEKLDEISLMLAIVESTTEDTPHKEMVRMIGNISEILINYIKQLKIKGENEK